MIAAPLHRAEVGSDGQCPDGKDSLRPGTVDDLERSVETLLLAFADYPYTKYNLSHLTDKDARRVHEEFLLSAVRSALSSGAILVNDDCSAVAIWWYDQVGIDTEATARLFGSPGAERFLAVEEALEKAWNTDQPVVRLAFVGIHPEHQNKGYGKALLNGVIRQIEKDGKVPIHLHTSVPKNVKIYEKFGFAVVAEYQTPDGEVPFWIMVRQPQI